MVSRLLRSMAKAVAFIGSASLVLATSANALPRPGVRAVRPTSAHGFNLFAGVASLAYGVNRVNCGIVNNGTNCVDPTGSPVNENGFWPKGTQDNYVFNSGLQIAGFVPNIANFTWANDTIGAFFFDPRGDQHHGEGITNIFDAASNDDLNNWPSAGMVTDTGLYNSVLIGRKTLSQEDLWVRYWDGNPSLATGRKHSMGLLVDQRILGWNFPSGNQDIIYVIVRFINITSNRAADYNGLAAYGYSAQDIADIYALAQNWRSTASAAYNVTIPDSGFAWTNLYASYAEDPDIGDASSNYSNGDLIFNTVAAYKSNFQEKSWLLPASIFSPPFAAAPGFMGIKYLSTPQNLGITMSGNTTNGLPFPDAVGVPRLWRNLSGNLLPTDGSCSVGSSAVAQARRMCYWAQTASDTRMFAASGPFTIQPGQLATIAAALVWAAPVASLPAASPGVVGNNPIPAFSLSPFIAGNMVPGLAIDGTRLKNNADTLRNMDRAMGFQNYADVNGDGTITQDEVSTTPRSFLNKELVAQAVFNNKFLLPFAPEAPGFFLVPGDEQITVAWQKSASETNGVGNPFFQIASKPTVDCPPPNPTHIQCANTLYDPNFRQFDVEGYRIYRGRTQAEMSVIAQFDYTGTVFQDFTAEFYDAQTYGGACAPELGVTTSCPRSYVPTPGNPSVLVSATTPVLIPLTSPVLQIPPGGRVAVAPGNPPACPCLVQNNTVDTAVTGGGTGFPGLTDTGVPFAYVDHGVLNGVRYFYAVTAFSINSLKSGPSSLESPLVTKTAIARAGSGQTVSGSLGNATLLGRGTTPLDPNAAQPTLDPTTAEFSGSVPPSGNFSVGFAAFVPELVASGSLTVTIDSIQPGSWFNGKAPAVYWFTGQGAGNPVKFSVAILGAATSAANDITASGAFAAEPLSNSQSNRFGGDSTFALFGSATIAVNGDYRYTNKYRGLVNSDPGPGFATGPRWWVGSGNENVADPNGINCLTTQAFSCTLTDLSRNAGQIPGVGIFYVASYGTIGTTEPVRTTEGITSSVFRAADFKWYWGANGAVDSVIDVTHNVTVPFSTKIRASWGIVNDSSFLGHTVSANATPDHNTGVLTWGDMVCVAPAPAPLFAGSCGGVANFTGTDSGAVMQNHARLSPVVFASSTFGGLVALGASAPTGNGFMLYLDGQFFLMQMAALPSAGTVWNLRTFAGNITGAKGAYTYVPASRPAAVPGLREQITYTGSTFTANVTNDSLLQHVHTVPDPYYVTTALEQTVNTKILRFVNLPSQAIIRIYSASGVLVNIVTHNDPTGGSEAVWDLRNRNNQFVASGVYFYHVETNDGHTKIGRFTVVNFAQ